jgi:hypothetical protein
LASTGGSHYIIIPIKTIALVNGGSNAAPRGKLAFFVKAEAAPRGTRDMLIGDTPAT